MYEILDRHATLQSPKRDWPFRVAVIVVALVMLTLSISLGHALHLSYQHHCFVQDVSTSLVYAREHHSLTAVRDGEPLAITPNQASRALGTLVDMGMGRPNTQDPSGGILIDFGDGSQLCLSDVPICEKAAESDRGLLVRYTYPDGHIYAYDTDRLLLEDLTRAW